MNQIFMKDKMINTKEVIIEELSMNRDEFKKLIRPIQLRRNLMYQKDKIETWDEINEAYKNAIFIELFDRLSQRLSLPVDELYIELESLDLSEFFEPAN